MWIPLLILLTAIISYMSGALMAANRQRKVNADVLEQINEDSKLVEWYHGHYEMNAN